MIFDGSKSKFHEILKTQNFTGTLPLVTAHVLKIARGSSLARISLPCGAAVGSFDLIWLVETLQVILLGARWVGTGQIVEQAGRR